MSAYSKLRSAVVKRVEYNRTRREIAALPMKAADDLGLNPHCAREIAHKAVYG